MSSIIIETLKSYFNIEIENQIEILNNEILVYFDKNNKTKIRIEII